MNNELDLIVLKTLITNKKHSVEFANENDAKIFAPEVWNFANLIVSYVKNYKDLPTLKVIIEKLGKGKNEKLIENIKKVWNQLDNISCDEKEYKHELEKIKKRFSEDQIISMKGKLDILEPGKIDVSKTLLDIQKTIKTINTVNSAKAYDSKSVKEYLPNFVEKFKLKKLDPNFDAGLKTHYSFFDDATNGVRPADFILIAGESGFGKSLLLNNIAVQVWMQNNTVNMVSNFSEGKDIIYFSLEMPYEDCFNRFLSRLSGVPTRAIENPQFLSREDFSKIKIALDFIDKYPYQFKIVDISDASANDLEAILTESGENFDAIFIDYLGIMKTNDGNDDKQDWLSQGTISQEIRSIGRRHLKPIFSAVQLNRKAPTKDPSEGIGLNRLARSATVATHATHVIQIETRPNEETHSTMSLHLIKNRKGPKTKGELIKNLSCATLLDNKSKSDDPDILKQFTDYINIDDISKEFEELSA